MIKQRDDGYGLVVCARVSREAYEALDTEGTRIGGRISDALRAIVYEWLAGQMPIEPMTTEEFTARL
jgi:predicted Fe-Mo cluster-binding NifX family protein